VTPNPKRVAAGRRNRQLRGPLTDAGRQRLREAALATRPWLHATGPVTAAGRRESAENGRVRQIGGVSVRAARSYLAEVRRLLAQINDACAAAAE
jgi:hypothetical protein